MLEWDMDENFSLKNVSLTIYSPMYDKELGNVQVNFDMKFFDKKILELKEWFKAHLEYDPEDNDAGLVGINSTSFNPPGFHHLFMEWDKKNYIPPIETLRLLKGTIIETANGIHLIKQARINWDTLYDFMARYECCQGFKYYSLRRKRATLRVSPKGNNHLRIIESSDGELISLYKALVKEFQTVQEEVTRVNS